MYRFNQLINGLVSRGWYCDEAIVRLVQVCLCSWLAMLWKVVCIWWRKVCRSCFVKLANDHLSTDIAITWTRMNCIYKRHHKWQRHECGWKRFNLRIYVDILQCCRSIFNNWSYVDSLGLNACKWVAWRTGMNLFLWYGLVLFRLDETTNRWYTYMYICIHVHWSIDRSIDVYVSMIYTYSEIEVNNKHWS